MESLISWVQQSPQTNVPILVAVIGVGSALLAGFCTVVVWPLVKTAIERAWNFGLNELLKRNYADLYLHRLIRRHRLLPILPTTLVPVTDRPTHELDNLYIDLEVAGDDKRKSKVDLGSFMRSNPFTIILGDPGAGKTTLVQYLILLFARAARNKARDSGAENLSEEWQRIRNARRTIREQFGFSTYLLPVPVFLSRLRSVVQWTDKTTIMDAIQEDLKSNDVLRDIPTGFFEKYLAAGRCLFLFDAFDELGSKGARDAAAQRIGELASIAPAGNTFIVTSRIIGYEGQLNEYGFQTLTVQPLSKQLTHTLITRWYDALGENKLADDLQLAMEANPRLAELAVNPMLLSLIVLVQYVRRVIPDRRHVLYDECVKILVERRFAPPTVQAEFNKGLAGEDAIRILRELAYEFHKRKVREISKLTLIDKDIPKILSSMPLSPAAVVTPSEILDNIEARSQLLVERGLNPQGEPVMAFSHLTFQEYLSSIYLKGLTAKLSEPFVSKQLITDYGQDPEWWEEVALLYAAQLEGEQQKSFFSQLQTK